MLNKLYKSRLAGKAGSNKLAKVNAFLRRRRARQLLKRKLVNKTGYAKVVRKCPEFWLQNTTVAGTPRLGWISGGTEVSYTGTNATLGTATIGMNGSYDVPFAMKFAFSDIAGYSDFATLADKYRIKGIYVRLLPNFTMNGVQSLYNYPSLQYITDDDDGVPPTVAQIREKVGVVTRTFKPGQYIGIKLKFPKIQGTVLDSTGTANAAMQANRWLDMGNPNVPHYGLKGIISNMDLPVTGSAKISIKFDVAYLVEVKDFQ